jgi:DNA-binding IclR family transcriptional regulator
MAPKVHRPVLTTSQAACLSALKDGKDSNTSIAIQAGLDLRKVIASLRKLEELGLARRGEMNTWSVTVRGKKCHFRTVPETTRQGNKPLGPGLRRLLDALDRPMRGGELAKKMGVSKQNVHHHIVKLYSLGQIRLGDPERPLLIVSRINDETPLLSYREERLLSAIPTDSATSAIKIKIATRLPEKRIQQLLSHLRAYGLIDARDGLEGEIVFGLTARGLSHPQRSVRGRRANLPSLPLRSDRVVAVLAAILDAGALRIRDIGDSLRIPQDSIRALIQYLKRKKMVQKTDQTFYAPYSLTEKGIETLSEMTRRLAA